MKKILLRIRKLAVSRSSKMRLSALAFIILMLASTFLVLSATQVSTVKAQTTTTVPSNMQQYNTPECGVNPERSYFTQGPAPNSPDIAWKAQIPGITGDFPIAFNGLVFVHSPAGIYALDGATGKIAYTMFGAGGNVVPASGTICKVDDTYMVIGSNCYKISDGTLVWNGPPGFGADVSKNGAGYIPELKMFVDYTYGWNLPDPSKPPTLAWNDSLLYNVGHGFIVAYGDGKIFVGGEDGYMRGVDAKTGTIIWETSTTSDQFSYGGSYVDGKVIFGGIDNNMYAWDGNTGKLLWTYNPHTWYGMWGSSMGAAYGIVYEHNQDTYLYAINATTGQLVWRQKGPGVAYTGGVVIADGKVYSPQGENAYRDPATGAYGYPEYDCYNAYTGQLIWTLPLTTGAAYEVHECIAYGNLYIIPIPSLSVLSGNYTYANQGATLGEVWCIGGSTQNWSMFMSDPQHDAEGSGPTNLTLKWTFQAGAQIVSQPIEVNGVCYFGSLDHNIYAVNTNTGTKIWNFTTGYEVASSVAVVNSKVYTGADDGNIYCLDATTGAQLWKTYAGGVTKCLLGAGGYMSIEPPVRSSPMVLNNKVYVGALDGNLYCLDANTGTQIWKFITQGPIQGTPTIVNGMIYFDSETGGLPSYLATPPANGDFYCLDANAGSVIWHNDIPYVLDKTPYWGEGNFMYASPTVANGMVFVSNGFLYTYAFNATTGAKIWTQTQITNPGTPIQASGVVMMTAPLYKYGLLYINDYYGVSCINANDGSEVWYTYLSREDLCQGLTYAYARVYTVNEFGALYVLDSLTGQKLSYYNFGGYQMHSSPSLYNGNLYIGCNDMNLYCFGDARLMSNSQPAAQTTANTQPAATNQPASNPTATPITAPTATPQTSAASSTNTTNGSTTTYIVIAAVVVVIVVIAVAAVAFTRRKKT